jgi:hypothetical protein
MLCLPRAIGTLKFVIRCRQIRPLRCTALHPTESRNPNPKNDARRFKNLATTTPEDHQLPQARNNAQEAKLPKSGQRGQEIDSIAPFLSQQSLPAIKSLADMPCSQPGKA